MNSNFTSALLLSLAIYTGVPLLFFILGNYPDRNLLKELISLTVILAFSLTIGQFYWSRANGIIKKKIKMNHIRNTHEMLGYLCVIILALHPFLLVLPRFFISGIDPLDALTTIVTTTSSKGIIMGMLAWLTLIILGITSLLRGKLPWGYQTWRKVHGTLAMVFIMTSVWHAIDLGRHIDTPMSVILFSLTASGVGLWWVGILPKQWIKG